MNNFLNLINFFTQKLLSDIFKRLYNSPFIKGFQIIIFCQPLYPGNYTSTVDKNIIATIIYCYHDSWKSKNFRKDAIKKRSKEQIPKRIQRGLRVITLQGAIEKSLILLMQYWKFEWLDGTIIILYLGGSNNIFADCTYKLHP